MFEGLRELRKVLEDTLNDYAHSAMKKPSGESDDGFVYLRGRYRGISDAIGHLDAVIKRFQNDDDE
jgi:hypothetical protein